MSHAAEGMISLSNIIKKTRYIPVDDRRKITVISHPIPKKEQSEHDQVIAEEERAVRDEAEQIKQAILSDAQSYAEQVVKQALEQAAAMKEEAEQEIKRWWDEQRELDEQHIAEAKKQGFEQGYAEGTEQAYEQVQQQCAEQLAESQSLLQQAYINKRQIIQEAEPFLLDLSCEIARKIIHQELTVSKQSVIDLIKKALLRKREQGVITLCVNPALYNEVQEFRDELALVIDSQAELEIVPDGNVKDHGCVIRSALGSIDARIDTQLTEIKQALHQIAMHNEGDADGD